jgi:uncharacterized membrane protein YgaE (UPF0421/DUF939 family)
MSLKGRNRLCKKGGVYMTKLQVFVVGLVIGALVALLAAMPDDQTRYNQKAVQDSIVREKILDDMSR